jgi:predicted AlkP superfamily phosphohydrolase/phosphomutase
MTNSPSSAPLILIGWDAATWDLLAGWAQAGHLPNLNRLMQRGVSASIRSTPLPLSPSAWSTIITGQNPGRHGVFDWFERIPGSYAVEYVHTGQIGARPIWEYFNAGGKTLGVFNVPMIYPAVPLEGFMLSGMAAPNARAASFSYPADLIASIEKRVGPYFTAEAEIFKLGREAAYLADMLAWLAYQKRVVFDLIAHNPCDAYLFVFMQSDHAQHKFWRYLDPNFPGYDAARDGGFRDAILKIYQALDQTLGDLLAHFGGSANIVLLSDHGAGPMHGVMPINRWLREQGYLHLRRSPATWLKYGLARSKIVLRAYRALAALGFGRIAQLVSKPARNKVLSSFLSFDDVDWSRTRAYARGAFGQIFINLKGREPRGIVSPGAEYESLVGEIIAGLSALKHPETDQPLITDLHRREDKLHGAFTARAADIMFSIQDYLYQASTRLGVEGDRLLEPSEYEDSGTHRMDGILVLAGPAIQPGAQITGASVADILPTALALAGLPVPADLDGRPLLEAFTAEARSQTRIVQADRVEAHAGESAPKLSADQREQLEDRLRSLGYL